MDRIVIVLSSGLLIVAGMLGAQTTSVSATGHTAVLLLPATPLAPGRGLRFDSAPVGKGSSVILRSITFASSDSAKCKEVGLERTSFPATTAYICVSVSFSRWHGRHKAAMTIYAPTGKYGSTTHQATRKGGGLVWTVPLRVAHDDPADHPGKWRVQITIDGRSTKSAGFTLTSKPKAKPTPTLIPTATPTQTPTETPVPPTPTSTPVPTFTLMGTLQASVCGSGYNIEYANVIVRDENNTVIGNATTSANLNAADTSKPCVVQFVVPNLRKAERYQIRIGTHDGPTYTFDELQAKNWTIQLYLN